MLRDGPNLRVDGRLRAMRTSAIDHMLKRVDSPENTGQADFTGIPLQRPKSQGLDHAIDIAGGFGIGECPIGGSLLETVGVLDLALSRRSSRIPK